ncbi:hypothetical protein F0562_011866 [Nyssa sinensis]|uniref:Uncharacterized protein n=1 Tax=Nyssa sinensis TaxID=561372 RepID=A0A5J4ZT05_9ASTE|nr:hypothetical protein F0562_011866 [Nyssa sinensis]
MTDEGFEEWDADFLDQLIQVEELALSCTNPTQSHPPPIPAPPPPPHPAPPYNATSYSPPRELSQRVKDNNKGFDQSLNGIGHSAVSSVPHARRSQNVKESEIDILKKELGRVSKQLTYLVCLYM